MYQILISKLVLHISTVLGTKWTHKDPKQVPCPAYLSICGI